MRVFVTGAMGYKGAVLVPRLLQAGHHVTAFDIGWFGHVHQNAKNLEAIVGDLRDPESYELNGVDCVIHLASIANDPSGALDQTLTWEISCLASQQLLAKCVSSGVKQFIYASSGSVYGIKDEPQVTEELPLLPLTAYNKTKMCAERIVLSYGDEMQTQIVRPATVCGLSPAMRNDVSVNLLTLSALSKSKITVFGGAQIRPNIHIEDICSVYEHFLHNPQYTGIFNAGFENLSISEIARIVQKYVDVEIVTTPSNDLRSYRINSSKLLKTGFTPKKNVDMAVRELVNAYEAGIWSDNPRFSRTNWMKENVL